ncbi:MAG TPA: methylamine dehydrogenase light chain [Candidatus Binatia bacterium]|nr:methylamine dehydrogenase light chain [Candidatus Binatia bacterium]
MSMASDRRWIDSMVEGASRQLARRTSRRSFLARLGTALVGGMAFPLLPVERAGAEEARAPAPDETRLEGEAGDPSSCDYWRYCGIHGYLCQCCGGSPNTCPPGTEMSPVTWIGTCRNPGDGKEYVISYNDCCGASLCGRCLCTHTDGEQPVYQTFRNNDLLWCFDTKSRAVHCSVAVVAGLATKPA